MYIEYYISLFIFFIIFFFFFCIFLFFSFQNTSTAITSVINRSQTVPQVHKAGKAECKSFQNQRRMRTGRMNKELRCYHLQDSGTDSLLLTIQSQFHISNIFIPDNGFSAMKFFTNIPFGGEVNIVDN